MAGVVCEDIFWIIDEILVHNKKEEKRKRVTQREWKGITGEEERGEKREEERKRREFLVHRRNKYPGVYTPEELGDWSVIQVYIHPECTAPVSLQVYIHPRDVCLVLSQDTTSLDSCEQLQRLHVLCRFLDFLFLWNERRNFLSLVFSYRSFFSI